MFSAATARESGAYINKYKIRGVVPLSEKKDICHNLYSVIIINFLHSYFDFSVDTRIQ